MGSADWMPRNLDKRVEILFPVEQETLKEKVKHILDIQLKDNVKTRIKLPDGSYEFLRNDEEPLCSQDYFCKEAIESIKKYKKERDSSRTFEPMTHPGGE